MLGMSGFIRGDDSHVAQQSRRDRLRLTTQLEVPTLPATPGGHYDHTGLLGAFAAAAGAHLASPSNNTAGTTAMFAGFQQNPNLWKCLGASPPPACDWAVSGGGGAACCPLYNSSYLQDVPISHNPSASSGEISMCDSQRGLIYSSYPPPFYQNGHLQEILSSPSAPPLGDHHHQQAPLEMTTALGHHPSSVRDRSGAAQVSQWLQDGGSELALLPTDTRSRLNADHAVWGMRDGGATATATNGQFLSLSSSSNQVPPPPPESVVNVPLENHPEGFGGVVPAAKTTKSNDALSVGSYHAAPTGGSRNNIPGNPTPGVGAGPLGPFTGYAAILKSSNFLRPAQQLLDESCVAAAHSPAASPLGMPPPYSICGAQNLASSLVGFSVDSTNISGGCMNFGNSSSSARCSSASAGERGGGTLGGNGESHGPQIQQKKAKLLFMQGEVCRKYKHYNQQMQMAISSFESVAGLSSAIPYLSMAIKTVSKHFRFLKGVISEQLVGISRALGEEFASMHSSCMGDVMLSSQQRFLDQALRRQKVEGGGGLVLEHSAPVWRPQRGLPDRAVAVLRAWLFDHFLHPYPTDTDKLMLATQTGLTRNQVSNWFINARVRVWKPMVEEIHMLETKGLSDVDLNSSKNDTAAASNANAMARSSAGNYQDQQAGLPSSDCSSIELASQRANCSGVVPWQLEKRPRTEHYPMVESVEGGLVGFPHYQSGGFDMAGLGVGGVSLTLGLRQEEGAPPFHPQIIRPPFGVQMVHNFVS